MLSRYQLDTIADWLKYCRIMSDDNHRRTVDRLDLEPDLKFCILKEQKRRVKELSKLERAVSAEIKALYGNEEGGEDNAP